MCFNIIIYPLTSLIEQYTYHWISVWHLLLPIGSKYHLLQKQCAASMSCSICCKMTCSVGGCIRASNKISLVFYINFLADYGLCGASQLMIACFSDARVKASFIGMLFYPALPTVKMLLGLRFGIICFSAAVTEFTLL